MTSAPDHSDDVHAPDLSVAVALVRAGQAMALETLKAEMVALTTVMANLPEPLGAHQDHPPADDPATQDAVEADFDNMPV